MDMQKIEQFHIIGISVRTTNENGQAGLDIPALWQKFMAEDIASQIPNKIDTDIYCIYTKYEKDHTKPYTTILGCKVENTLHIPAGMVSTKILAGNYEQFTAKGNLLQGLVYNEWIKIWNTDLPRTFTADFELYGEKSKDPTNAEVAIFVAVE
jgi:predicted transcriptional regulator YdeE